MISVQRQHLPSDVRVVSIAMAGAAKARRVSSAVCAPFFNSVAAAARTDRGSVVVAQTDCASVLIRANSFQLVCIPIRYFRAAH